MLVFLLLFAAVVFMIFQRLQIIRQSDDREMSNLLESVQQNITQYLQNSYTTALSCALTINDNGEPENFEQVAAAIMNNTPGVDGLQLLPGGVITYVYPYESNKSAIGLNILKEPHLRDDARKAVTDQKFYFAGPLELRQGGIGVVGRLPIYVGNKFWGFANVIIKLESLIEGSGINSIDQSEYYFQLSRVNPYTGIEEFYLPGSGDFKKGQYKKAEFPDSGWNLYIISRNHAATLWQLIPLGILGVVLASLFGFSITRLLKQPAELRAIVSDQAEKLAEGERRYRTIFNEAAVGILYVESKTGTIIEANRRFAEMLESDTLSMRRRRFQEFTHPDDIEENERLLRDLVAGKINSFQMEKRYVVPSGKLIWVNLTVVPLELPEHNLPTHLAVVEDITIAKLAKEKIKESESRFKGLFEDSPVALWEEDFSAIKVRLRDVDSNQSEEELKEYFRNNPELVRECISLVRVIDVNNQCLQMHHPLTREDLLKGLNNIIDEFSSEVIICQLIAIVKNEKKLQMESKMVNCQGEVLDVLLGWTVIRGYEDTLERVVVSTEDITPQKNIQRLRLASQKKVENLINTIDGIVWECDAKTHKLNFISKKVKEILGYSLEDCWSNENFWYDHIHPDDLPIAKKTFDTITREHIEAEFEYRMISKHGDIVWIRDIVSVHHEDDKTILRGIMLDITEHKEADADLSSTLKLVNEQKKRLMNFSYIVSHNLRSHNANIQSIINLVELSDSDEERRELISHLKTVSDSLDDTMQHLGELVNIQSNIALVTEPLRINHYVDTTRKILSELIAAKHVTIINNIPDSAVVVFNPAYLESVILNLVSNAIRYSHPERNPFIKLDWAEEEDWFVLKVADNGLGIDMARYGDKMFGMYKTFHGNPEARGVGLFMTRSQVEAMGGQIRLESEPGKGSTFQVYFRK